MIIAGSSTGFSGSCGQVHRGETYQRYGKWTAVSIRCYRWRKAGIWDRIWSEIQSAADE